MNNNPYIGSRRPSPARHGEDELLVDTPPFSPEVPILPTRNATAVEDIVRQQPNRLTPIPLTALVGKSTLNQQSDTSLTIDDLLGRSPTPNINDFCKLEFDNISPPGTVTPLEDELDEDMIERLTRRDPTPPPKPEREVNTEPLWVEKRRIADWRALEEVTEQMAKVRQGLMRIEDLEQSDYVQGLYEVADEHRRQHDQLLMEQRQQKEQPLEEQLKEQLLKEQRQEQLLGEQRQRLLLEELRQEQLLEDQQEERLLEKELQHFEREEEECEIQEEQERITEHKEQLKWQARRQQEQLLEEQQAGRLLEKELQQFEKEEEECEIQEEQERITEHKEQLKWQARQQQGQFLEEQQTERLLEKELQQFEREEGECEIQEEQERIAEHKEQLKWQARQDEEERQLERDIQKYEALREVRNIRQENMDLSRRANRQLFRNEEREELRMRQAASHRILSEEKERVRDRADAVAKKIRLREQLDEIKRDRLTHAEQQERIDRRGTDEIAEQQQRQKQLIRRHKVEVFLDEEEQQTILREEHSKKHLGEKHRHLVHRQEQERNLRQHLEERLYEQDQQLVYNQHQREVLMNQQLTQEEPLQAEVDASLKKRRRGSKKKRQQQQRGGLDDQEQHLMYDQHQQEAIMDQQLMQEEPLQTQLDSCPKKARKGRKKKQQQEESLHDQHQQEVAMPEQLMQEEPLQIERRDSPMVGQKKHEKWLEERMESPNRHLMYDQHEQEMMMNQQLMQEEPVQNLIYIQPRLEETIDSQMMQEEPLQTEMDASSKKRGKKKQRKQREGRLNAQDYPLMYHQHQQEMNEQLAQDEPLQTEVDASPKKAQKSSKKHRQWREERPDGQDQHSILDQYQQEEAIIDQLMREEPLPTKMDASLKEGRKGSKKHSQRLGERLDAQDNHLMYDQHQHKIMMDQPLLWEEPLQMEGVEGTKGEQESSKKRRKLQEGETDEERRERRRRRKARKERQRLREEQEAAALLALHQEENITEDQASGSSEKLVVIKRPERITFETIPYPRPPPKATSASKSDAFTANQLTDADQTRAVTNTTHLSQTTAAEQSQATGMANDEPAPPAKTPFIKALLGPPAATDKRKPLSFKWRKLVTSQGKKEPMKATAPMGEKEEAVHFQFDDITSVLAPTEGEQEESVTPSATNNPRPADPIDEGNRSHKYLATEEYKPNSNIARMISKYMKKKSSPVAHPEEGQGNGHSSPKAPHPPTTMQPRPPTAKPRPRIAREKVPPPRKQVFHAVPDHEEWKPQRFQFPQIKQTGILRSQPVCPKPPTTEETGQHIPRPPTGKPNSRSYRARLARQGQKVMPGGRVPDARQQRRQ